MGQYDWSILGLIYMVYIIGAINWFNILGLYNGVIYWIYILGINTGFICYCQLQFH